MMRIIAVFVLLGVQQTTVTLCSDSLSSLLSLKRVNRVIGGEAIEKGDWPWLVLLKGEIPAKYFLGIPIQYYIAHCGGSVVNKRWVLTAAHCFRPGAVDQKKMSTPKYWHAKVGEVERDHGPLDKLKHWAGIALNKHSWQVWNLHGSKLIIHPEYDADDLWKNDIALLKLEKDLPVGPEDEDIGLVQLPEQDEEDWPTPRTECIMKGWGCSEKDGTMSKSAYSTKLPAIDDDTCRNNYWRLDINTQLCAGYDLQHKGICKGDSGGPLVCKKDKSWIQAGIASFTSSSRPGQVPGGFTRVSKYVDWIQETIYNN